jgi:hypothetical protein
VSLDGPLSRDASNGEIEMLHDEGGTVRLDDGQLLPFSARDCYRDGTSFSLMRVGDRCLLDREETRSAGTPYRGISSPNGRRLRTGGAC